MAGYPHECRDLLVHVDRERGLAAGLGVLLEDQFRHHHLPPITLQPILELGLGCVAAPGHDGMDGGANAPHPGRRLECSCQTPYHRSGAVQQFPSFARIHADLQRIIGSQRGDGAMHLVVRTLTPCETQIDLVQARPPVSAGKLQGMFRS